jgi:hypothetical protein
MSVMPRPLFLVFLIVLLLAAALVYADVGRDVGWFDPGV